MDGSEWSFDNLNSICWAIGSISGCLPEQDEKQFLIHTIKNLLNLCEMKRGKENKAVVAANIMYVVGQYPKFLRTNWNFLKTVVKKLFEFMRETFEGVQEMACNTFLTISQKCGKEFVIKQTGNDHVEKEPYIYELIRNVKEQLAILQDPFKLVYYESLAHIIRFEEDMNLRISLVINLLAHLTEQFNQVLTQVNQNVEVLKDEKIQGFFIQFLRVHQKIVQPIGFAYQTSLIQILKALNDYYLYYSQQIAFSVQNQGKIVMNWYTIKKMRQVKREILKLYSAFFQYSENKEINNSPLLKEFVILPICILLEDYSKSINEQKEFELLILFKNMFEKVEGQVADLVPLILTSIFESTIGLISEDFNSYPDHRNNFFEFLRASVTSHLAELFSMPPQQFKLMIDCIVWAFKHQVPNLQELGLDLLYFILQNVNQNLPLALQFYQQYYMRILKDILEILTDSLHASGFKLQSQILQILFSVASSPQINCQLCPEQAKASNLESISQYLITSLSNVFTNVSRAQTEQHIMRMFTNVNNSGLFRRELSDYLINLKQFVNNNEHLIAPVE